MRKKLTTVRPTLIGLYLALFLPPIEAKDTFVFIPIDKTSDEYKEVKKIQLEFTEGIRAKLLSARNYHSSKDGCQYHYLLQWR